MKLRRVTPVPGPLHARVEAVPSKSVTHRALVAAALANGRSVIHRPLDADDTRITLAGLAALGLRTAARPGAWIVEGRGGAVAGAGDLRLGDSGTSLRFLLAVASLGAEASRLDGSARLRERPVHELAESLLRIGARVELTPGGGGLPLSAGGERPAGGTVRVAAGRSSQFASALLLIGPRLAEGIDLTLAPPVVSFPYVELTADVLTAFGARIERPTPLRFRVRPTDYPGREYTIEGDHSTASYFLAAAAVVGGSVRVEGVRPDSVQADARLGRLLEQVGCRVERGADWIEAHGDGTVRGFDVDLADSPDLGPTLGILALFAPGPSTLRGAAHLRLKESDRLALLAENLQAMGREAVAREDRLEIGPAAGSTLRAARIRTASDHRMAMAFAVAGLRVGAEIDDADCVSKSNPEFWNQLAALTSQN